MPNICQQVFALFNINLTEKASLIRHDDLKKKSGSGIQAADGERVGRQAASGRGSGGVGKFSWSTAKTN